ARRASSWCNRAANTLYDIARARDRTSEPRVAQILDLLAEESWRSVLRVNSKCAQPSLSQPRRLSTEARPAKTDLGDSFVRRATRGAHHSGRARPWNMLDCLDS